MAGAGATLARPLGTCFWTGPTRLVAGLPTTTGAATGLTTHTGNGTARSVAGGSPGSRLTSAATRSGLAAKAPYIRILAFERATAAGDCSSAR